MPVTDDERQEFIWSHLRKQVVRFLRGYGVNEAFGKGDYYIVDDNYGWKSVIIEICRVHMLRPEIIAGLRSFLRDLPDWEIIVKIGVPGDRGKMADHGTDGPQARDHRRPATAVHSRDGRCFL